MRSSTYLKLIGLCSLLFSVVVWGANKIPDIVTNAINLTTATASRVMVTDGSKNLTSSTITTTQLGLLGTATDANTPSTLVKRDASGNFSAGTITTTNYIGGNGSLSTPTYSFSNSPTAGMYRVGADDIGFAVNGVLGLDLKKSTSGFVNIGMGVGASVSDGFPLIVQRQQDSSGVYIAAENTSTALNSKACIELKADNGNNLGDICQYAPGTAPIDSAMRFSPSGNTKGLYLEGGTLAGGIVVVTTGGDPLDTGRAAVFNADHTTSFYNSVLLNGTSSGTISLKTQAAAGTYNWNWPTTAGTTGQPLLSGGGSTTAMTFGTLGIGGGGTNNASLAVTAGGTLYTDGSKLVNVGAGTTGQVLKSNGASAPAWGNAQGGLISDRELISNTDIEIDASGYTAYADAAAATPVDCTGGSPNSTIVRSTLTPITGLGELLWTKSGVSSRQGEGFSIPFTVGTADQAKVLQIDIDSIVRSGTFVAGANGVDSDLEFYIYSVTDSQLIQPTTYKIYSTSTTIPLHSTLNFQTTSAGTSYRLCVHTATTSTAGFTVGFDNISIHPSRYVYGSPITDWVTYTPTFTGFGTVTTQSFQSRRVGANLETRGRFVAGTPTATEGRVSFPSGPVASSALSTLEIVGTLSKADTGSLANWVLAEPGVSYFTFGQQNSGTGGLNKQNGNTIISTSGTVSFMASVPIAGWGATVQMSDSADQRVVIASVGAVSAAVTANAAIPFSGIDFDSHGAITLATGRFTAPVPGYYSVSTVSSRTSTSGNTLAVYKNGVMYRNLLSYQSVVGGALSAVVTVQLNSGEYVDLRADGSITLTLQNVIFQKVTGPSTIGATESVNARYHATSSTPGTFAAPNAVTYTTKDYDSHGAYSGNTYTIPIAGKYRISASTYQTAGTTALGGGVITFIYKNGVAWSSGHSAFFGAGSLGNTSVHDTVQGNAGDTIQIYFGNNGTTPVASASNTLNFFAIERVGN